MARKNWSEAECAVLVALYMQSSFSIADDARGENKKLASDFSRDPGSVDRQWRNIKDYLNREPGKNISATLKYYCDAAMDDIGVLKKLALHYCGQNEWYLVKDLLENEST